jgi:hypothetical protein
MSLSVIKYGLLRKVIGGNQEEYNRLQAKQASKYVVPNNLISSKKLY